MINLTSYLLLLLCTFSFALADVRSGILVAVSGEHTASGHAVICQNIEASDENVKLKHFPGKLYNFTGLILANDTTAVYAGQNSVGFAIVSTPADLSGEQPFNEGKIIKESLGSCGRLKDFIDLLKREPLEGAHNYACLDAFGRIAVVELVNGRISIYDLNDAIQVRAGFLVRSNFAFSKQVEKPEGSFRYSRARALIEDRLKHDKIDIKYLTQRLLRDIATEKVNPYPIEFDKKELTTIRLETCESINRYNTVASIIFQSSDPMETARIAWCALGQPIATVYFPFNPRCHSLHRDITGNKECRINRFAQEQKNILYPKKSNSAQLEMNALVGGRRPLLQTLFSIEDETREKLTEFLAKDAGKLEEQCHELQSIIDNIMIQIR